MKRRTTFCATAAAAAAAAVVSLPAGATLTTSKSCDAQTGRTVVANATSRIYFSQYLIDDEANQVGVRVYRCKPGSGDKPETIASYANPDETPSVYPVSGTLRGNYGLIEYVNTDSPKRFLRLYDFAARKLVARYERPGNTNIGDYLAATGGFAVTRPGGGLVAFDGTGARTLVSSGVNDVAAGVSSVFWRQGTTTSSSPLPSPPSGTVVDPS